MSAPLVVTDEQIEPGSPPPDEHELRKTLRVVIACRRLLVGQVLAVGLSSIGDVQVTVLHPDDSALTEGNWGLDADIVLIAMEDRPSSIVATLHRALPASTRIVVMAEQVDLLSIVDCIGEGASGYLTANSTVEEVGSALRRIDAGQMVLPLLRRAGDLAIEPVVAATSIAPEGDPRRQHLTPREQEVLRRLTRGQNTADIARDLQISINTTRSHIQHLLKKLQLHSRLELTAYAVQNRLLR
ncbi:MAG TPA: response regulator transcription factor [Mycobacteriales bacterium]|nr:response regulator transcription factor [Mycobacteriales bacterium]